VMVEGPSREAIEQMAEKVASVIDKAIG
jgi:hypothetical protein